jgi:hypothetical protein
MTAPYQLPDLIMARLSTLDWPVRHVAEIGSAGVEAQIAPAILVIPYGLQIADDGDETAALERVLVVAVTRSVNQRGGQEARQKAGSLLSEVATLLKNWQPTTGHTPLEFETPPQPQFVETTALYPLQFSSNFSLTESA